MQNYKELETVLTKMIIHGQRESERINLGVVHVAVDTDVWMIRIADMTLSLDNRERGEIAGVLARVLRNATRVGKGVVISGPTVSNSLGGYTYSWVMATSSQLLTLGRAAQGLAQRWLKDVERHAATDGAGVVRNGRQGTLL